MLPIIALQATGACRSQSPVRAALDVEGAPSSFPPRLRSQQSMSRALRTSTSELQLGVLYRSAYPIFARICKNYPSRFVSSGSRHARCRHSADSFTVWGDKNRFVPMKS